jgi:L-amino acid N-acyltransferase YncA
MVLTVRAADPRDAPAAMALLNAIIAKGGTTAMETPLSQSEVEEWLLSPGLRVWFCHIAEGNGVLQGFQSVGKQTTLPAGWGEMGTYAAIGATQRGIGTALFTQTVTAARALGLCHLNALIRSYNSGGLAYYNRVGFGVDTAGAPATLKSGQVVARIAKRFDLRIFLRTL